MQYGRLDRVPVQPSRAWGKPAGTIAWTEHVQAYAVFVKLTNSNLTPEQLAKRGFSYSQLCDYLGREPESWETMKGSK